MDHPHGMSSRSQRSEVYAGDRRHKMDLVAPAIPLDVDDHDIDLHRLATPSSALELRSPLRTASKNGPLGSTRGASNGKSACALAGDCWQPGSALAQQQVHDPASASVLPTRPAMCDQV